MTRWHYAHATVALVDYRKLADLCSWKYAGVTLGLSAQKDSLVTPLEFVC